MDDDFSHEARRLLQDYRDRQTDDKSSRRSSSRHHDEPEYSYKEVNAVLENVIYSNGSPGLAKQLIELGADVNFARKKSENVWKKISRKNQHDQRSDLLLRAVTFSQPQLVAVMVPHADQENLNSVLPNAIARGDLAILRVLLDHGADPAELHNEFEDAVLKRKTDLVATLAAGPKRPCLGCLSKGLATAVKMTSLDTVNQLVAAGADVNYDFGMALLRAVDAGRPDYVAALLSGAVPPHADTLDATLGRMLKLMGDRDPEEGSAIIEMCLRAGAAGPETERLLTKGYAEVVGRRQLRLLDVMLKSRKPAGPFEAQALAEAVKTEDPAIVVALLQCHPSSASMTAGVREAMRVDETGLRHEMLHLLVDAGARKACLSEALVQVVRWLITDRDYERATSEKTNMALFSLILDQGEADVDFNRGEALQLAVQASCTELVWSMVSKQPRPVTLGTALPLALQVRKPEDKEAMVEILLRHRVDEAVVNQALIDSVQGGQGNLPITSLLVGRANVNHNGGQAFSLAIHNIDIHTLRVLLTKTPNSESLMAAVNRALSLERDDRQTVFNDLSGHLPKQHLNAALRQVALEVDVDLFLTQHLLRDGADATLDDGACMSHAAINLNTDLLRILGKYSGRNEIVYTGALGSLVNTHRGWIAEECTELIDMLLRNGAAGVAVDRALADVVEELGGEESERALADHFFRVFLAAGADVNFEDGVAARSAARKGDAHMLRRLLQQPMMTETASRALSTVMTAGHDEHLVVDLLGVFLEKTSARADPDIAPSVDADGEAPRKPLPIFLCLDLYPTSVGILHRLLALGCDLEVTLPCHVYPDEASGEDQKEDATVLLWALAQANNKVSSLVISELIEFGGTSPARTLSPRLLLISICSRPVLCECGIARNAIDTWV